MRFSLSSLKTGILAQLVFLIVAAMLLIHVVEVKFSERDLIRAKARAGRLLMGAVEQLLGELGKAPSDPGFRKAVGQLLSRADFSALILLDPRGETVLAAGASGPVEAEGASLAREALATGTGGTRFSGSTWGVIWLGPKDMIQSTPLFLEGRLLGAAAVHTPLRGIYQGLRKTQGLVLFYILLDTVVLTIVGVVLLSRIVVKPIQKLLKMTGEYKDGDMIPVLSEVSGNEIGELSRSLGVMLRRLGENKRDLRDHIASLEKANRELQQAHSDLIRTEKLASVGRLAAGIAHEIGNPIGIALGYLELLRRGDLTEEEQRDFLERMEHEIKRINRIIRQLLDFSRPSSGKPEWTSVHELIVNTVNILKPQPMMQPLEIRYEMEATRCTVLADPNRLQQVFLNIIMNAADALGEMETEGSPDAVRRLVIRTRNSEENVVIEFSDNGPGIGEEDLGRIFDPFYTTKEPGKGTGLGLSVSYRIVESMGGSILAESSRRKGTTIRIMLPPGRGGTDRRGGAG